MPGILRMARPPVSHGGGLRSWRRVRLLRRCGRRTEPGARRDRRREPPCRCHLQAGPGSAHFSPTTGPSHVSCSPFRAPEAPRPEAGRAAAPEGTEGSGRQPGRGAPRPSGQGRVALPTRTGRPWYVTAERGSLEVWRHGHRQWSKGAPGASVPVRPAASSERSTTAAERTHHGGTCRANAWTPWRDGSQKWASRGACQMWRGVGVGHRIRLSLPVLVKED